MNLNKFMDLAEQGMVIEFDDLTIRWIGPKKGPYTGKDGTTFYNMSLKLDDGTYTYDYEKNGETREGNGVFALFSHKDWMNDLKVNDHIACKLKYDTYNGRPSIKGSYLHRAEGVVNQGAAPTTAAPNTDLQLKVEEYENLIKQVIDPLFNAFWAKFTPAQQQQLMTDHKAQIGALNRYLPE